MLSEKKFDLLYKYDNPINWNFTGFGNEQLMWYYDSLIELCEKLNLQHPIHTIHGSYLTKYNGGRLALYRQDLNKVLDKIESYNKQGIGIKLTFSNSYMTKDVFEEKELNEYLEVLNNTPNIDNGIICSVNDFADYIHKNYPNVKVTASYVKMASETRLGVTDTTDYYNKQFNIYDNVVMNTFRAFDDEFLKEIKYPDRVEFIVNNSCNCNCPISAQHYKLTYELCRNIDKVYNERRNLTRNPTLYKLNNQLKEISDNCNERKKKHDIDQIKYQFINRDEINHLSTLGFKQFKLEGRDLHMVETLQTFYLYIIDTQSLFWKYYLKPTEEQIEEWRSRKLIILSGE